MDRLVISSPGTIYPVLDSLREKHLVDCETEVVGTTRKRVYSLTQFGEEQLHEYLTGMVSEFCADMHVHIDKIMERMGDLLDVSRRQRILCTIDYQGFRRFFQGSNVAFPHNLADAEGSYDLILGFLGAGCILSDDVDEISEYVRTLDASLEEGGMVVVIEIEKTENIFARFFFERVFGLTELPGLEREGFQNILKDVGFRDVQVISLEGLLFAFCSK